MEELFVYGTLKNSGIQKAVFGRVIQQSKQDILDDYTRCHIKIDNSIYPIIKFKKKRYVTGIVFFVTDKELKLIDAYEGDEYTRKLVVLRSGATAWVYVD